MCDRSEQIPLPKRLRTSLTLRRKRRHRSVAPFLILVPQKFPKNGLFFYYFEVSGVSLIISRRVRPVLIPTTYLNFSDDPAFRKLSRCSGRPF